MIDNMAKKKANAPEPVPDEPHDEQVAKGRLGIPVQVYVSAEMRAAISLLLLRTRRKLSTEIVIAIEKHLRDEGFWPLPPVE